MLGRRHRRWPNIKPQWFNRSLLFFYLLLNKLVIHVQTHNTGYCVENLDTFYRLSLSYITSSRLLVRDY